MFNPFGNHHNRIGFLHGKPGFDGFADTVNAVFNLRNKDDIPAACQPCIEGDPAGIVPHYLNDHGSLVRVGGRMESVDGIRGNGNGRVKTKGDLRAIDIVVDGFWNPNHVDACFLQLCSSFHGPVAADANDAIELKVFVVFLDQGWFFVGFLPLLHFKGFLPGSAENGSSYCQNARKFGFVELDIFFPD